MYATLSPLDFILGIVLFPLWLTAALLVRRLATRPDARRVRRGARIALALLTLATLLAAARIAVFAQLSTLGWEFVGDRRVITTLLMLAPGVLATLFLTFPGVFRLARRRFADGADGAGGAAVPDRHERASYAAPRFVLPPQAAAFGALGGFFEKFLPPNRSGVLNAVVYGGVLVVGVALLALRARTRATRVGSPEGRRVRPRGRTVLVRVGTTVVAFGVVGGLVVTSAKTSEFPGTFSMMKGTADYGGGPEGGHEAHTETAGHAQHGKSAPVPGKSAAGTVSVADLKGPRTGTPDRRFTLVAQEKKLKLASGRTIDAWTFNGQIPGPELRMKEGELVEITLINRLTKAPVTSHWHGVDVPNAEDGVAGATQDAVQPGGKHVYRFRVGESGSRWYHSHQQASEQVKRGLFGPLVIEPKTDPRPVDRDVTVVAHDWETKGGTYPAFGASDELERRKVAPGEKVRLRLMNTSTFTKTLTLTGVPYKVTSLDGTDLNAPGEIEGKRLEMGGATRMDVEFTMPSTPVRLADTKATGAGIAFSPDGRGTVDAKTDGPEFDKTKYGEPKKTEFTKNTDYDRNFKLVFDDWLGFYNGKFGLRQTVNGRVFPDTPMLMVQEGDLVKMRFVNRGEEDHPMHLHGHHVQVLSRNGKALTGSPVWLDTVLVKPGEEWEVAFKADNPGVWMDHCHNFVHTSLGMVLHLSYAGVSSPYHIGGAAHNKPE